MVRLAGPFLVTFLAILVYFNQSIFGVVKFYTSLLAFIASYEGVMGTDMPATDFRFGLFYLSIAVILMALRGMPILSKAARIGHWAALRHQEFYHIILSFAVIFLSWKLGSHRSVSSYGIFLYMMPMVLIHLAVHPVVGEGNGKYNFGALFFVLNKSALIQILRLSIALTAVAAIFFNDVELRKKLGVTSSVSSEFYDIPCSPENPKILR